MTENDNIEKLFRDSFEDFRVQPPAGIKAQIDKGLRGGQRKAVFWITGLALLAVLGVLGFNAYFSDSNTQTAKQTVLASSSDSNSSSENFGNGQNNDTHSQKNSSVSSTNPAIPASASPSIGDSGNKTKPAGSPTTSSAGQKMSTAGNNVAAGKTVSPGTPEKTKAHSVNQEATNSGDKHTTPKKVIPAKKIGKLRKATTPVAAPNISSKSRNVNASGKLNPAGKNVQPGKQSKPKAPGENAPTNTGSAKSNDAKQEKSITTAQGTSMKSKTGPGDAIANTPTNAPATKSAESPSTDVGSAEKTAETAKEQPNSANSGQTKPATASLSKPGQNVTMETSTPKEATAEKPAETKTNKTGEKDSKGPDQQKRWLAQIQPGIGFSAASKAVQDVKAATGFSITGGFYRQFGNAIPIRAGLDISYHSGNFNWSTDSTTYTTVTHDSIVPVQVDSTIFYDTVYYTVSEPHTQTTDYRSSYTQFAFGLSTQIDAPLTDKLGLVLTPGIRYAQTKFVRQSDGSSFKSGRTQLNLGLDVYYDWKYWRFSLGVGYTHTWMKAVQNPFQATGVSQFAPRIGVGIRF